MSDTLHAVMRTIALDPVPRWPIEHRNIRAVHGTLTASVWAEPHNSHHPNFALLPWPQAQSGWAALWVGDRCDRARELATRHAVNIFHGPRVLTLGPPISPRAPRWTAGDSAMRIDTVTPISIMRTVASNRPEGMSNREARKSRVSGSLKVHHPQPTTEVLTRALAGAHGLQCVAPTVQALEPKAEVVLDQTRETSLYVGPKQGHVKGFAGRFLVIVNPAGRYLLECAALVGMGSRLGFGFGRFRLTVVRGEPA